MSYETFNAEMDKVKQVSSLTNDEQEISREKAMQAFRDLRAKSDINFPDGMSLEEINAEINMSRYGGNHPKK